METGGIPEITRLPAGSLQSHANGSPDRPMDWGLLHYRVPGPARLNREASLRSFHPYPFSRLTGSIIVFPKEIQ
jgi:hypothetical protein